MSQGRVIYTPFISKPIPESSAISPIPISSRITEYQAIDSDKEVIPIQYTSPKLEVDPEPSVEKEVTNPFKWAKLTLRSSEPTAVQPISIPFPKDKPEGVISGEPLKIKYDLTQYNPQKQSNSDKAYEPQYPVGEKEDYNTVETSDKPIEWKFELGVLKPKIGNTYSDRKEFVKDLTNAYEKELESRGLSKEYAKYIVAQDALESTWGKSSLARYYNFGGIKEFREGQEGVDADTKESFDGKTLKTVKQRFRKFKDLEDYVKYKIDLLGNSNFNIFAYRPDQLYNRLVTAPKKYATDPDYENKMNKMYKSVLALFS